jgi:hypothetical protein
MSLASRRKVVLHADMHLQWPSFKPTPAASSKVRRLRDFGNAKHVPVERSGFILTTGRHCKLDVI